MSEKNVSVSQVVDDLEKQWSTSIELSEATHRRLLRMQCMGLSREQIVSVAVAAFDIMRSREEIVFDDPDIVDFTGSEPFQIHLL